MGRKKKPITLQKIPLDGFIETLVEFYNRGALYIDIVGTPDDVQDMMTIIVKDEYIDPDNNRFGNGEFMIDDGTEITDQDINELPII